MIQFLQATNGHIRSKRPDQNPVFFTTYAVLFLIWFYEVCLSSPVAYNIKISNVHPSYGFLIANCFRAIRISYCSFTHWAKRAIFPIFFSSDPLFVAAPEDMLI